METKLCTTCNKVKSFSEFNKNKYNKCRHFCKQCQAQYTKDHYQNNKKLYFERGQASKEKLVDTNRRRIIVYKLAHPCVDCGETDPITLQFDHLLDKEHNISKMIPRHKWLTILTEIEKCEVVCANCHAKRTAKRFDWPTYWITEQLKFNSIHT